MTTGEQDEWQIAGGHLVAPDGVDWGVLTESPNPYAFAAMLSRLERENRQLRDKAALADELRRLIGGWREVIAEIDDLPKSEALGKAMWASLDQIDDVKARYDALKAKEATT